MTTTTHATPEPDDAATTEVVRADAAAQPPATPTPPTATPTAPPVATERRTLGTGAIVGIALGGVALCVLLFGGGVAVGIALPVGGAGGYSQTGLPGGENRGPGDQGTRPDAPRGDTNRSAPTAPNTDETETPDDSDAG